jgi:tetratricopeptide (TPR) repeat protein
MAALVHFRQGHDVLREANCIYRLGEVALAFSNNEEGLRQFEEALPLYRTVSDAQGEGNCITRLGDIALTFARFDEARRRYDEALVLYRRLEDALGEAYCVTRLGDVALHCLQPGIAQEHYTAALACYARALHPYAMGATHFRLARLAGDPAEKQRHVDTARALWTQINRPDLVAQLDAEFGRSSFPA